mmetsp:Transcript_14869/g.42158  ORF Transcript_14869/g.42158 Transcript_14869/m.42158 type:complete len:298 (+) Transcript_14869:338-1231(+)
MLNGGSPSPDNQTSKGSLTKAHNRPMKSSCLADGCKETALVKASSVRLLRKHRSSSAAECASDTSGKEGPAKSEPDAPSPAATVASRQRLSSSYASLRNTWTCEERSRIRICNGCTTSTCTARTSSSSCASFNAVDADPATSPWRAIATTRSTSRNSVLTTGASSRPRRFAASSCSAAMDVKHAPIRSRKELIISPTRCPMRGTRSSSKCARSSALNTGSRHSFKASPRADPTVSCSCFAGRMASTACPAATPPDFCTARASASQNFRDVASCWASEPATPSEILLSSFSTNDVTAA